jgi:hypothetical protein
MFMFKFQVDNLPLSSSSPVWAVESNANDGYVSHLSFGNDEKEHIFALTVRGA